MSGSAEYCIPGLYKPGIAELAEARGDLLSFAPHYRQFQPIDCVDMARLAGE